MMSLHASKRLFCYAVILLLAACDNTNSGFPAPECGGAKGQCAQFITIVTTPNVASLLIGMRQQFKTSAIFSDASLQDITQKVTWSVSNNAIATINNKGVLTVKSAGEVMVTATLNKAQSHAKVIAIDGIAEQLTIFPTSKILIEGTSEQYSAFVTLMDGQVIDVSAQVKWAMQNTRIAQIDTDARVSALSVGDTQLQATFTHQKKSLEAQAALSVNAANVRQIVIHPANGQFPVGSLGLFHAVAYFTDGHTQDITRDTLWNSSNTNVGNIVRSGVHAGNAVALSLGETEIAARFHTVNAITKATVTDAVLLSIAISPVNKTTPIGIPVNYQAYGLYSDGTKHEITTLVAWSVSDPSVANIDVKGAAYPFAVGSTDITATYSGLRQSVALTVSDAIITSLQITPQNPQVSIGTTGRFTAIATYSDKTTSDVTQQASWSSADQRIAAIMPAGNLAGYAIALKEGLTEVFTNVNGIKATTLLTVNAASITSVSLTPRYSTLPAGTTEQLQLFAIFSDGHSINHTLDASFQSDNPAAVSIDNHGLATAHFDSGSDITLTATYHAHQATATLRVTPALLVRINITPATMRLPVGHKGPLKAWAIYSDGTISHITHLATWSVDDSDIVSADNTHDNAGDVLGISPGTAIITASFSDKTATNTTTILPPAIAVLESVSISPIIDNVIAGLTQQYRLTAQFSDKSTLDVTASSHWISSDNIRATIDTQGQVTGHDAGSVTITGTYQGLSADARLTVLAARLERIQISPVAPTEPVGTTGQFTALGFYSDGHSERLSSDVTWTSSNNSVVSITTTGTTGGHASADKVGTSIINARLSTISATTQATVIEAPLQSIVITPARSDIVQGMHSQFSATGIYGNGIPAKDITDEAHWLTNNTAIATITSRGYAKGESQGIATITASINGKVATAALKVDAPELVTISVLPAINTLPLGTQSYYQAIAVDSAGKHYVINNEADWSITDTTIAHVDNSNLNGGLITPLSTGSTTVEVNFLGETGRATLTVSAAMITRLEISPLEPVVIMRENQQFTATAFYSDATSQDITELASWQSSNTGVATVQTASAGLLNSHAFGVTDITAAYSGYSAQTTLTVQEKDIDNLQITPHVNYISVGAQVQLKCNIIYVDASLGDCTKTALWTTADSDIAHIEPSTGLVTGLKVGDTRALASYHGVTSRLGAQISVREPAL